MRAPVIKNNKFIRPGKYAEIIYTIFWLEIGWVWRTEVKFTYMQQ